MIWSLVAKEKHSSLFAVEAAVAEAVLRFNTGNQHSAAAILGELNMNSPKPGSDRTAEKYLRRSLISTKRHAALGESKKGVK